MRKKNYFETLTKIVEDLKGSPDVELVRGDLAEGTDADYINGFLRNRGLKASKDYVEFYTEVDYVEVEWVVRPKAVKRLSLGASMSVSGRINIPSFETILMDLEDEGFWFNLAWREYASVNELSEPRPGIPFDYCDPNASGCACVGSTDTAIGKDLIYFDHGTGTLPLGLTIKDYVGHLSGTRGVYGWQKALAWKKTKYSADVKDALSKLFPKGK